MLAEHDHERWVKETALVGDLKYLLGLWKPQIKRIMLANKVPQPR
jgi:hypothetical protein